MGPLNLYWARINSTWTLQWGTVFQSPLEGYLKALRWFLKPPPPKATSWRRKIGNEVFLLFKAFWGPGKLWEGMPLESIMNKCIKRWETRCSFTNIAFRFRFCFTNTARRSNTCWLWPSDSPLEERGAKIADFIIHNFWYVGHLDWDPTLHFYSEWTTCYTQIKFWHPDFF